MQHFKKSHASHIYTCNVHILCFCKLILKTEFVLKFKWPFHHVGSAIGYPFADLQIDNLKKIWHWHIVKKLARPRFWQMIPFWMCLSIRKENPNQDINNAQEFMDRKAEKVQNGIFWEFRPIFRYCCGTQPKFDSDSKNIRAYILNTYIFFKKYPLIFLWNSSFPMTYKGPGLVVNIIHNV